MPFDCVENGILQAWSSNMRCRFSNHFGLGGFDLTLGSSCWRNGGVSEACTRDVRGFLGPAGQHRHPASKLSHLLMVAQQLAGCCSSEVNCQLQGPALTTD